MNISYCGRVEIVTAATTAAVAAVIDRLLRRAA